MIIIDPSGDLTVGVVEYDDSVHIAHDQEKVVLHEDKFLVKRSVLVSSSDALAFLIARDAPVDAKPAFFQMKDLSTTSMEIWFRSFHATMTPSLHQVKIEEMWNLAVAGNMYDFDIELLYPWFKQWYAEYEEPEFGFRQLLYPCWQYNHAVGFMVAAREAVYNSVGHITETNPTKHYEHHLPNRVIQQLNAAKGRLRTKLHTLTFKPIQDLLRATCNCKERTTFQYIKALHDTGVWPFDPIWPKKSTCDILVELESFSYTPPGSACRRYCQRNYEGTVRAAISYVRSYFDGLCLDCMDKSKPKTADFDSDYWHHNELDDDEWDRGCRARHGEPTWYFSFMGRKEDREAYCKKKKIRLGAP